MIGTAEERRAKRREQIKRQNAINGRVQFVAGLTPGTLAMFNTLRKQTLLSTDVLLYKLVRLGQKHGL